MIDFLKYHKEKTRILRILYGRKDETIRGLDYSYVHSIINKHFGVSETLFELLCRDMIKNDKTIEVYRQGDLGGEIRKNFVGADFVRITEKGIYVFESNGYNQQYNERVKSGRKQKLLNLLTFINSFAIVALTAVSVYIQLSSESDKQEIERLRIKNDSLELHMLQQPPKIGIP